MTHSKPLGLLAALALGCFVAPGLAWGQGGQGGGGDRGRIDHEFYIRVTPATNIDDLIAGLAVVYPGVVASRRDNVRHLYVVRFPATVLNVGAVMSGTCAADFDASGSVDPDDLADFITAYFATSPAADADGSGTVDPDDLADFISRYFSADPCG